jgi:hypothetical protein
MALFFVVGFIGFIAFFASLYIYRRFFC